MTFQIRPLLLATSLLLGSTLASAQVSVQEPWVRATVAQQKATGAFMQLTAATATRLVAVKTAAADRVEIHEVAMDGDTMMMRSVPGVDLAPGQRVEFKPGGYHIMLLGLKQPLKAGDLVALTLVLEGKGKKRETVEIQAPVRALGVVAQDPKR